MDGLRRKDEGEKEETDETRRRWMDGEGTRGSDRSGGSLEP